MEAKAQRYYPPVDSGRTVESVALRAWPGVLWRISAAVKRRLINDEEEKWLMLRYIGFGFPRHNVHLVTSNQAVGHFPAFIAGEHISCFAFSLLFIPAVGGYDCLARWVYVVRFLTFYFIAANIVTNNVPILSLAVHLAPSIMSFYFLRRQ